MFKKRIFICVFAVLVLSLLRPVPVGAQEEAYTVHLRRDFGYGAGSNVRGTFSISITGDESQVVSVEFLIDGQVMATLDQPPFRFQFHTDSYGFGEHYLSARVHLQDGRIETTPERRLNFVTPGDERGGVVGIVVGVGGAILFSLLVYALVQMRFSKGKPKTAFQPGQERSYGMFGGTICPKCGRPFPRHWWGLNMVAGRLDRCEHCGKWSMTTRAAPEALRAAEAAEVDQQPTAQPDASVQRGDADRLEDTKFFDEI
jgi:hypothetical protein